MTLIGSSIGLACAILYSVRSSFVKDVGGKDISKAQINFYIRLISLPIIAALAYFAKTRLSGFGDDFYFFFVLSLLTNTLFGFQQISVYKKHKFSDIESFFFLIIIFNLIAGFIVFGEIITLNKLVGIFIVISAFLILLGQKKKNGEDLGFVRDVTLFYLVMSAVDLFNKKTIVASSPLAYSLTMSIAQMVVFFFLSFRSRRINFGFYKLDNKQINLYLLLIGVMSSFTVVLVTYGYQLLPLGILATIVSLRVFISLWISHKKYLEDGIKIKLYATAVAFIGTAIIFLF